jgi:hypothetical protein
LFAGNRYLPIVTRVQNGGDFVTNRADEYRRRAEQCLRMAVAFHNHQARDALLHMAHVWLRLADNYDDFILPAAIEQTPASSSSDISYPAQMLAPVRRQSEH